MSAITDLLDRMPRWNGMWPWRPDWAKAMPVGSRQAAGEADRAVGAGTGSPEPTNAASEPRDGPGLDPRRVFYTRFALHDRVCIDGDDSIVAVVTQVCWGDCGANVQVSWWASGDLKTAWVSDLRLSAAPEHLFKSRVFEESCP